MMKRRKFLEYVLGSTTASAIAPMSSFAESKQVFRKYSSKTDFIKNLPPGLTVELLGQAYLKMDPSAGRQCEALKIELKRDETEASLSRLVEADFEKGDTLRVGGWVFSETELRLCALQCLEA